MDNFQQQKAQKDEKARKTKDLADRNAIEDKQTFADIEAVLIRLEVEKKAASTG